MKEYKFYWVKYKQNSVENKTVFRAENMKKPLKFAKKDIQIVKYWTVN